MLTEEIQIEIAVKRQIADRLRRSAKDEAEASPECYRALGIAAALNREAATLDREADTLGKTK